MIYGYARVSTKGQATDKLPAGKKPCLSLRELEKQIGYDLDSQMHPEGRSMTVEELVERYLSTRIGVKPNTKSNSEAMGRLRHHIMWHTCQVGLI